MVLNTHSTSLDFLRKSVVHTSGVSDFELNHDTFHDHLKNTDFKKILTSYLTYTIQSGNLSCQERYRFFQYILGNFLMRGMAYFWDYELLG
mgnify:FL=1